MAGTWAGGCRSKAPPSSARGSRAARLRCSRSLRRSWLPRSSRARPATTSRRTLPTCSAATCAPRAPRPCPHARPHARAERRLRPSRCVAVTGPRTTRWALSSSRSRSISTAWRARTSRSSTTSSPLSTGRRASAPLTRTHTHAQQRMFAQHATPCHALCRAPAAGVLRRPPHPDGPSRSAALRHLLHLASRR